MKALSLSQPMAWAIFHGKDVENRTWPTKHRGRIYIHAAKSWNQEHWRWIVRNNNRLVTGGVPFRNWFVRGKIIGEVDIVDCVENHGSRWFTGPYAFVLANAVEYEKSIPYRGRLKLFNIPCSEVVPCCDRRNEYNGFSSGPLKFVCPKHCSCHD